MSKRYKDPDALQEVGRILSLHFADVVDDVEKGLSWSDTCRAECRRGIYMQAFVKTQHVGMGLKTIGTTTAELIRQLDPQNKQKFADNIAKDFLTIETGQSDDVLYVNALKPEFSLITMHEAYKSWAAFFDVYRYIFMVNGHGCEDSERAFQEIEDYLEEQISETGKAAEVVDKALIFEGEDYQLLPRVGG